MSQFTHHFLQFSSGTNCGITFLSQHPLPQMSCWYIAIGVHTPSNCFVKSGKLCITFEQHRRVAELLAMSAKLMCQMTTSCKLLFSVPPGSQTSLLENLTKTCFHCISSHITETHNQGGLEPHNTRDDHHHHNWRCLSESYNSRRHRQFYTHSHWTASNQTATKKEKQWQWVGKTTWTIFFPLMCTILNHEKKTFLFSNHCHYCHTALMFCGFAEEPRGKSVPAEGLLAVFGFITVVVVVVVVLICVKRWVRMTNGVVCTWNSAHNYNFVLYPQAKSAVPKWPALGPE